MSSRTLFIALPAALLIVGSGAANAGTTVAKMGAMACINDKWNESEPDKDHKLVDYAGRCVHIPDNQAVQAMSTEDCVGSYEYMPDKTWKGAGTCTVVFKDGDKLYESWEARTSRNPRSRSQPAPASTKAPRAAALMCTSF